MLSPITTKIDTATLKRLEAFGSDVVTVQFTKEQAAQISEALALAMNNAYKHLDDAGKDTLLKASFAWRTAQPEYDPQSSFKDDCAAWGCD